MNLILFYNKILYKKIIKICAWCPGKDEKDKKAKKNWYENNSLNI